MNNRHNHLAGEEVSPDSATQFTQPGTPIGDIYSDASNRVNRLSKLLLTFRRNTDEKKRGDALFKMQEEVSVLRNNFSAGGLEILANFSTALGRLLAELAKAAENANSSTFRAISQAVDFLSQFLSSRAPYEKLQAGPLKFMVVDDAPVCRRAMMMAFKKGNLEAAECESAQEALVLLTETSFDVIFTDIMMPEMDGFDFCIELRKLPEFETTPVVFVTAASDFETRSRTPLSGGCELIAKPIVPSELVVKALTLAIKYRVGPLALPLPVGNPEEGQSSQPLELPKSNLDTDLIVTSSPELSQLKGVICMDEKADIQTINKDVRGLLGYTSREVIGCPLTLLIPDEFQKGDGSVTISQILDGYHRSRTAVQMVGRRKDNSAIGLSVTICETKATGKRMLVAVLRHFAQSSDSQPATPIEIATSSEPLISTPPQNPQPEATPVAEKKSGEESAIVLRQLSARLDELNSQLDKKRAELEQAQLLNEKLEQQFRDASTKHSEFSTQLEQHDQKIAELDRTREQWERCAQERAAQLEELRLQLQQEAGAGEQLQRMTDSLEGVTHELRTAQAELGQGQKVEAELKMSLEKLQQEDRSRAAELNRLQSALTAEEAARAKTEQAATELEAVQNRLQQELAENALKTQRWERDRQVLQDLLRAETEETERARAQLAESLELQKQAEGKLRELSSEADAHRQKLSEAAADAQAAQEREQELRKQVDTLSARSNMLQEELSTNAGQKQQLEQRAVELHQTVASLEDKVQERLATEKELKEKCGSLEQLSTGLTQTLAQMRCELANEAQRRSVAERKIQEELEKHAALERTLAEHAQAEEQLRQNLAEAQQNLRSNAEDLATERRNLEARSAELQETRTAIASLTQTQSNLKAELASAHDLEASLQKKINDWASSHESVTSELGATQAQLQETKAHHQELKKNVRELQEEQGRLQERLVAGATEADALHQQVQSLESELDGETQGRAVSESKLQESLQSRASLEQSLAQHTQAEEQLRCDLAAAQQSLQSTAESLAAERCKLEDQATEVQAVQTTLTEVTRSRAALQAELANADEHNVSLQKKIEQLTAEYDSVSTELSTTCAQLQETKAHGQTLELTAQELQKAKVEVEAQAAAAAERANALQEAIQSLRGELKERAAELATTRSSHAEAQENWLRREAELTSRLLDRDQELAHSSAAVAERDEVIRVVKGKNDELAVVQDALGRMVQGLTAKEESLVQNRTQLEQQLRTAQLGIQNHLRELAGLRYSILNTARIQADLKNSSASRTAQDVQRLKPMVAALLNTPTSITQRRLLASLETALEQFTNDSSTLTSPDLVQIEPLALNQSEFNLDEIITGAFEEIRATAERNGVKAAMHRSGPLPQVIYGDAGHLHQLLSLLGKSVLNLTNATQLEVQASADAKSSFQPDIGFRLSALLGGSGADTCARLTEFTDASGAFNAALPDKDASAFAAAWQLACAMGCSPRMKASGNNLIELELRFPVSNAASLSLTNSPSVVETPESAMTGDDQYRTVRLPFIPRNSTVQGEDSAVA